MVVLFFFFFNRRSVQVVGFSSALHLLLLHYNSDRNKLVPQIQQDLFRTDDARVRRFGDFFRVTPQCRPSDKFREPFFAGPNPGEEGNIRYKWTGRNSNRSPTGDLPVPLDLGPSRKLYPNSHMSLKFIVFGSK